MTQGKFQGAYVQDMKNILVASSVSGLNVALVGKPGYGKTKVANAVRLKIYGTDHSVLIRFRTSSPPEVIKGREDIGKFLTENKYELILEGTPYQPGSYCALLDEFPRAMDPIFDEGLDVMDRLDIDDPAEQPVNWITANFMMTSERTEAVVDRIGLIYWLPDESLDMKEIAKNQLQSLGVGLDIGDSLPTLDDIKRIRGLVPDDHTTEAIATLIEQLVEEARKGSVKKDEQTGVEEVEMRFDPNPRSVDQWGRLLYRYGVWLTGNDQFNAVPQEAIAMLRYAWPSRTQKEAMAWASVCDAIADPIDAAIKTLCETIFAKYRAVEQQGYNSQKAALEFGNVLAEGRETLKAFAKAQGLDNDPRVEDALVEVQKSLANYMRTGDAF